MLRAAGIAGYRRRRRVTTAVPDSATQKVSDLLGREFTAATPNTTYVGDITYLPLATGATLYLATVIGCYSRRVTAWAIAEHMRTELIAHALHAADTVRGGLAGAVFHSDHGSQGGFNCRRNTPDDGGACNGDGGLESEDQRCSRGTASAVAS